MSKWVTPKSERPGLSRPGPYDRPSSSYNQRPGSSRPTPHNGIDKFDRCESNLKAINEAKNNELQRLGAMLNSTEKEVTDKMMEDYAKKLEEMAQWKKAYDLELKAIRDKKKRYTSNMVASTNPRRSVKTIKTFPLRTPEPDIQLVEEEELDVPDDRSAMVRSVLEYAKGAPFYYDNFLNSLDCVSSDKDVYTSESVLFENDSPQYYASPEEYFKKHTFDLPTAINGSASSIKNMGISPYVYETADKEFIVPDKRSIKLNLVRGYDFINDKVPGAVGFVPFRMFYSRSQHSDWIFFRYYAKSKNVRNAPVLTAGINTVADHISINRTISGKVEIHQTRYEDTTKLAKLSSDITVDFLDGTTVNNIYGIVNSKINELYKDDKTRSGLFLLFLPYILSLGVTNYCKNLPPPYQAGGATKRRRPLSARTLQRAIRYIYKKHLRALAAQHGWKDVTLHVDETTHDLLAVDVVDRKGRFHTFAV